MGFHKNLGFDVTNRDPKIILFEGVEAAKDYNGPGNHMVMFSKDLK